MVVRVLVIMSCVLCLVDHVLRLLMTMSCVVVSNVIENMMISRMG